MALSRTSRTCGQRSDFTGTGGRLRREVDAVNLLMTRPLIESARRSAVNRRDSLKALSAVTAHSVFPSVRAGAAEVAAGLDATGEAWTPRWIRPPRAAMLEALVDTILPATDTPGARQARVQVFVDLALRDCYSPAEQQIFVGGLEALADQCQARHGQPFEACAPEQRHALPARLDPWDLPYGNLPTQQDLQDYPIQSQLSFLFGQDVKHFLVKDVDHPYEQKKPFHWFRGYQVGGRSLLWSRHCFRWSELDFEANLQEGVGIDWPLRYPDLPPSDDSVQAFIGISGEKAGLPQLPEGDLLPPFEMNCFEQHLRQSIATSFPGRNPIMSHVAVLTRPHKGRGACKGRNLCHRGYRYGAYFSSNSSTLPAAPATGRLTLRAHSIVHSLISYHEP